MSPHHPQPRISIGAVPRRAAYIAATFACRLCGEVFASTIDCQDDPFSTECRACHNPTAEPIAPRDDDGQPLEAA